MFYEKLRWREALESILFGHRSPDELMIAGDQTIGLAQCSCHEDEDVFAGNLSLVSLENLYVEGLPDEVQQQSNSVFSAHPVGHAPDLVAQFTAEK